MTSDDLISMHKACEDALSAAQSSAERVLETQAPNWHAVHALANSVVTLATVQRDLLAAMLS